MVKSKEENGQSDFSVNLDQDFQIKLSTTKKHSLPDQIGLSKLVHEKRKTLILTRKLHGRGKGIKRKISRIQKLIFNT